MMHRPRGRGFPGAGQHAPRGRLLHVAGANPVSFSKMSLMKEIMMDMTLDSMLTPGCTCLGTLKM
jgi:hypothetical protein